MRFVHQHGDYISDREGRRFIAQVYTSERLDHSWEAWCVLFPAKGDDFVVTDRETTQSTVEDVRYWASGLTHRYYEGALERALRRDRAESPLRHNDEAVRRRQHAAEAEAYAVAAEAARERAYEHELMRRAARRGVRFG